MMLLLCPSCAMLNVPSLLSFITAGIEGKTTQASRLARTGDTAATICRKRYGEGRKEISAMEDANQRQDQYRAWKGHPNLSCSSTACVLLRACCLVCAYVPNPCGKHPKTVDCLKYRQVDACHSEIAAVGGLMSCQMSATTSLRSVAFVKPSVTEADDYLSTLCSTCCCSSRSLLCRCCQLHRVLLLLDTVSGTSVFCCSSLPLSFIA